MFCESCKIQIPPAWVLVIAKNECPACGGAIMSETSKALLSELKEAMAKMPNDPEGLAGWLLSNYTLSKIGDAEPTTHFNRKPSVSDRKPNKKDPQLKIAKNPVADFLKRTNAAKGLENRQDLKELVETINSGIDDDLYGTGEELETEFDENIDYENETDSYIEAEELDPYEQAELNRKNFRSVKNAAENNSLVLPGAPGQRPLSRQDQAAISAAIQNGPNLDAVGALNEARKARLQKSRDVANGGGSGSFRRT